ncbi:MAG: T9SS type A sorting domain-containing protein, partial [Alcaligenaceae bacterium]
MRSSEMPCSNAVRGVFPSNAGEGDSRVIVVMSAEKPDGKELEELQEKNENIPTPKREMEADNLNLYPNPTGGRFTLNFDVEHKGNTSIKVFDVNGREVYSEQVKGLKGTYNKEIDITG